MYYKFSTTNKKTRGVTKIGSKDKKDAKAIRDEEKRKGNKVTPIYKVKSAHGKSKW